MELADASVNLSLNVLLRTFKLCLVQYTNEHTFSAEES